MPSQCFNTLTSSDIPYLTCSVYRTGSAEFPSKFELSARDLSCMLIQYMNAFAWSSIPDLILIFISFTIAFLSNDPVKILSPSALKCRLTISPLWPLRVAISFPESTSHNLAVWSLIILYFKKYHRTSCNYKSLRIKLNTNYFKLMTN